MIIRKPEYESILQLEDIICLKASTERTPGLDIPEELSVDLDREIKIENNEISTAVALRVTSENKAFSAEVIMLGTFSISGPFDDTARLLAERNTVSILFPYMRSHLTLITSQPGMTPIIIPPMNINTWFESENSNN